VPVKSLWFKQQYAADILSGTKTDTIRKRHRDLPKVGDVVTCRVAPRAAFAEVVIVAVEPVRQGELDDEQRRDLALTYGEGSHDIVRVSFSACRHR
jgi:hypothetical protein